MITLTDGRTQEVSVETFSSAKCFYNRQDIMSVEIPAGIKTIRKESFFGCTNLESVTIPYGVTSIEPSAFEYCASLRSIKLPESLKVLSEYAFRCSGLESIVLPQRLKTVAPLVFSKCPNLLKMVVPEGYKASSIGVYADRIQQLVIPESLEHIRVNTPRSRWYRELNCKNMAELMAIIDSGASYSDPTCFYMSYFSKIYGPCNTLREAYDSIREDIIDFANTYLREAYDTFKGDYASLVESIDPSDADLMAANIVVDFWKDPDMTEYDILHRGYDYDDEGRSGRIEQYPIPEYEPGDMLYVVEAQLWHDASFHPRTELYGIFTDETEAKEEADATFSYQSYPISRELASVRRWLPGGDDFGWDFRYLDGYEPDRWPSDEEEEDEEDEGDEETEDRMDCAYLIIAQSSDGDEGTPIKAEAYQAYFCKEAARKSMYLAYTNALGLFDETSEDTSKKIQSENYCYDKSHCSYCFDDPDNDYSFEDFESDYTDQWTIWTESNHLLQFSVLDFELDPDIPIYGSSDGSRLYAVVEQNCHAGADYLVNYVVQIFSSKEDARKFMHSTCQEMKASANDIVRIEKEIIDEDMFILITNLGHTYQYSILEFNMESPQNEFTFMHTDVDDLFDEE